MLLPSYNANTQEAEAIGLLVGGQSQRCRNILSQNKTIESINRNKELSHGHLFLPWRAVVPQALLCLILKISQMRIRFLFPLSEG